MSLNTPLRFRPHYVSKPWGGRALDSFLRAPLEVEGPIGEVWTLVDRDEVSSVAEGGDYDGRSLRGLMLSESESLVASPVAYFPLLVKYLDVQANLSVQVHPDETAARRLGGEVTAKTECWYVLDAKPEAHIYLGFRAGIDPNKLSEKLCTPEVVDILQTYTVRAGDFVQVPAGTIHALGGGITLVEVQENSDTTYRVFDWGRLGLDGQPRDLHFQEAMSSIDYESVPVGPVRPAFIDPEAINPRARLTDPSAPFSVDLLHVNEPYEAVGSGRARVLVVLSGHGRLCFGGPTPGEYKIQRGETWLIPAGTEAYRLDSADGELRLLEAEAGV